MQDVASPEVPLEADLLYLHPTQVIEPTRPVGKPMAGVDGYVGVRCAVRDGRRLACSLERQVRKKPS